jgi:hypothetical protein
MVEKWQWQWQYQPRYGIFNFFFTSVLKNIIKKQPKKPQNSHCHCQ